MRNNSFTSKQVRSKLATCREFDGLLWGHSHHLWDKSTVETKESLVLDDFAETVEAVAIHHFKDGRRQTLILHSRFHQVDRIHCGGSDGCTSQTCDQSIIISSK